LGRHSRSGLVTTASFRRYGDLFLVSWGIRLVQEQQCTALQSLCCARNDEVRVVIARRKATEQSIIQRTGAGHDTQIYENG
jgi:hypothetical protein